MSALQNDTLTLNLGEREWGTIPRSISIEDWFYNESKGQRLVIRIHSELYPLIRIFAARRKTLVRLSKVMLAGIFLGGAFIVQKELNKSSPSLDNRPYVAASIHEKNSQKPIASASKPSLSNVDVVSKLEGQNKNEPLIETGESVNTIVEKYDASFIANQNSSRKEKYEHRSKLQLQLAEKKAKTNLPPPPTPIELASKINVKPPLPKHLTTGEQINTRQNNDLLNRNTMMAISETPEPAAILQKEAGELGARKVDIPTPSAQVEKKPVEVKQAALPNYKLIAITKNSVVISDSMNPMPRQFKVGEKLPSGELIKSVSEGSGVVVTDSRTLKSNH